MTREPRRGIWCLAMSSSISSFARSAITTIGRPPAEELALHSWSMMGRSLSDHPSIRVCCTCSSSGGRLQHARLPKAEPGHVLSLCSSRHSMTCFRILIRAQALAHADNGLRS